MLGGCCVGCGGGEVVVYCDEDFGVVVEYGLDGVDCVDIGFVWWFEVEDLV